MLGYCSFAWVQRNASASVLSGGVFRGYDGAGVHMSVKVYPRNLLVGVLTLALFAWGLKLALDFSSGAAVGVLAPLLYLVFELGLTFNPSSWVRGRRA